MSGFASPRRGRLLALVAALACIAPTWADINARQNDGSTALLLAVYAGDVQRVSTLLKSGADVRIANEFGATPLSEAARTGNTQILAMLLKAGANPRAVNQEGETALHEVARTGNIESAKLLLRAGADIEARETWAQQTPLHWAASQNQPEMIRLLLSKGANPDARATVRDWQRRVTAEGRPKDMNRGGFTPLLLAARDGFSQSVKALLQGKADINLPDPDGTTPLLLTLINGHWDTAKLLIESGANVNDWDFWGQSPLYIAVDMNILPAGFRVELPTTDTTNGIEVIRMLLARGANANVQLKLRPPYRNAVQDRGADATLVTGATPLMRAATGGDVEVVKLLLAAGALVDLPNEDDTTPLMAAVSAAGTRGKNKTEEDALACVRLLHAAGANVNASSRRGMTAAHSAALRGWNKMLSALAGWGANLDARESDKLTPLDYAMGRSRVGFLQTKPPVRAETAALLRQLGAKAETPTLPPWPGVGTPGLRAIVPE
ncbi:MAG: ankyrin repeat domain-containing protein [Pseudomonadota bacterium]